MPKTIETPQNLRVDGKPTASKINVAWDHSGNPPLDGFYLSWKKQGGPLWTDRKNLPTDARNTTITGLDASTTYEIQVEAYANRGGRCGATSSPNGPITATTSKQGARMAPINRIDAEVKTANISGAGTNSAVYLGIAGREFHLDSEDSTNDFEAGDKKTYIFGDGSNVDQAQYNDPRAPKLDTVDLDTYPTYVRSPNSDWALEDVTVTVNPGAEDEQVFENAALATTNDILWFGATYGEILYLTRRTAAPDQNQDPGQPKPQPEEPKS